MSSAIRVNIHHQFHQYTSRLFRTPTILAAALAVAVAFAAVNRSRFHVLEKTSRSRISAPAPVRVAAPIYDTNVGTQRMHVPGIAQPHARRAEESELTGDERVIGVVVSGEARAYVVGSMSDPKRHIVNDVIADRPVTIAYCDIARCARAFTGNRGSKPLDVAMGGLYRGQRMMIVAEGKTYFQDSLRGVDPTERAPAFPFESHFLTLTTWKEWKNAHPNTRVCTEFSPAPPAS